MSDIKTAVERVNETRGFRNAQGRWCKYSSGPNTPYSLALEIAQDLDAANKRLEQCVAALKRAHCYPIPHDLDTQIVAAIRKAEEGT